MAASPLWPVLAPIRDSAILTAYVIWGRGESCHPMKELHEFSSMSGPNQTSYDHLSLRVTPEGEELPLLQVQIPEPTQRPVAQGK